MRATVSSIWDRVVSGDPDAWEALVLRYASLVYSVACRCGLTSGDAEDCAQQTWIALYHGRHSINDPSKLPAWLTSTTKRKAVRMRTRLQRAAEVHDQSQTLVTVAQPDEAIIELQRKAQIEYALEQLDGKCRHLLTEIFFSSGDTSYRDIARKLGIPMNSLGPTRMRCLAKLKKILMDLGYE